MPSFLDDAEPSLDYLDPLEDEKRRAPFGGMPEPPMVQPHPIGAGNQATIRELTQPPTPQPGPDFAPQSDPVMDQYKKVQQAQERATTVAGQKPQMQSPKWWQRAISGAAGAGAGWVNAAGRTRVGEPVSASHLANIGMPEKLTNWQNQSDQAQAGIESAQGGFTNLQRMRQMQGQEETAKATQEHLRAQAKYQNAQAVDVEENGKRDDLIKLPDGALYSRSQQKVIREAPAKTNYSMQKVVVKIPGAEKTEIAWADPRNPGRLVSSADGTELPAGTKIVSEAEETARIRANAYGDFGNFYRAGLGQGLSEDAAKRRAGEMVDQKFGWTKGTALQNIDIKSELSGIGGAGRAPTIPQNGASSVRQPTVPSTPPKVGIPPPLGQTPKSSLPLAFNDKETGYVNQFIGQLLGTLPVGRGGMAGQIGVKRGMELIAKRAGVDPMTLNANLVQDKGVAKQLMDTVQRTGAIQRLNNTLDMHGTILATAAAKIPQTDAPFLNTPVQKLIRGTVGSPELKRYLIAINAVQREYAYLTAGGAQSKAMLPVTVTNTMDKLFQENSTLAEILAGVDQVKIEAKAETAAMNKTQQDLIDRLRGGITGRAVSGQQGAPATPPPAGGPKVGDVQSHAGATYKFDGKQWVKQ